jgi:hypothetical protein
VEGRKQAFHNRTRGEYENSKTNSISSSEDPYVGCQGLSLKDRFFRTTNAVMSSVIAKRLHVSRTVFVRHCPNQVATSLPLLAHSRTSTTGQPGHVATAPVTCKRCVMLAKECSLLRILHSENRAPVANQGDNQKLLLYILSDVESPRRFRLRPLQ